MNRQKIQSLPFKPIINQGAPNEQIEYDQIKITLPARGTVDARTILAKPVQYLLPKESLKFEIIQNDLDISLLFTEMANDGTFIAALPDYNRQIEMFFSSSAGNKITYSSTYSPIQIYSNTELITSCVFSIFNWPDFFGDDDFIYEYSIRDHSCSSVLGRIVFELDTWMIEVMATEKTREMTKELRSMGGYAITHVGRLKRIDNSTFTTDEADKVLNFLHYFFSFVLGRWTGPNLTIGFDAEDNKVYELMGLFRVTPGEWQGSSSWFDKQHAHVVKLVAPGFWKLWISENWNRTLIDTMYWYLGANQIGNGLGVDSALLLSQSALELLSWTLCVQDRKLVSEVAYKPGKLSASDKIRMLITSLNIPAKIPDSLVELQKYAAKEKWVDGPHAITELRNDLVHPGKKQLAKPIPYYDVWRLSLWYIELAVLRLCDYNGKYACRLKKRWVGSVDKVPWS